MIYLFMAGAPSHLELFDNKPQLAKFDGQLPPAELLKGYRAAFINPNSKLLGPKFKFAKHGKCGAEISELLPHLAGVVDDIAIVQVDGDRRVQPRAGPNFDEHRLAAVRPAEHGRLGDVRPGERVAGPARVTSCCRSAAKGPSGGSSNFGQRIFADRVPGRAVPRRRRAGAVSFEPARASTRQMQRDSLDALRRLNEQRLGEVGDPEIATRIN